MDGRWGSATAPTAIRLCLDRPLAHGQITPAHFLSSVRFWCSASAYTLMGVTCAVGVSPSRSSAPGPTPSPGHQGHRFWAGDPQPSGFPESHESHILKHFLLPCINHQIKCYYPKNTDLRIKCTPSVRSLIPTLSNTNHACRCPPRMGNGQHRPSSSELEVWGRGRRDSEQSMRRTV